jgi:hypothetical protein
MKNMSNILVIVIGSLMVFSQPLIVALHAETLQNKFCGVVAIPFSEGSVSCASDAVVAGVYNVGASVIITTGVCSAVNCVGTTFYQPSKCCYTTCDPKEESRGTVHVWKKGC